MNFNEIIGLNIINGGYNWKSFQNIDDFKKIISIVNHFDSYNKFCKFMKVMKSIPTISQVNKLTHDNTNLFFFEFLQSYGYFNLIDPIQKYYLFVEACSHDSVDIAMLIFSNSIDLEGVKEFMQNFLIQVGTNTEYVIFRKIWEKNIIQFNQEEIEVIFFYILKSSNVEFIEWFFSLNLVDLTDGRIREKICLEVLANASNINDYKTGIFIFYQYLKL